MKPNDPRKVRRRNFKYVVIKVTGTPIYKKVMEDEAVEKAVQNNDKSKL